ncbi:MAG: cation:proton antiporter [Nitrospirae bacterium]|nr:cation:proton antiporter [Nitrospirota bacterium]
MENLTPQNIIVMFLSLGILLGVARVLGELAQRLRQPSVLGELFAGVLLGPTVLGNVAPDLSAFLFPPQGPNAIILNAITTLAVVLFLLVAGIEVNLSTIRRQGHVAFRVSISGILIPFLLGFAVAWLIPQAMGRHLEADPLIFALFFATALSISALPVIAKTLMDLDLYRSDLGMVIVSAAIFNDLVGWIVFAIILGLMGAASGHANHIMSTIVLTLAFAGFMLTLGRWLIHKVLPLVQAHTRWPGGVLGFALTLALLGAAFTEWIGIHAIFGAFLVGVAIGDSSHLRERTRATIDHFVSFIFAPVFFAGIGLKVNFLTHFDLPLVLTVLLIACGCKIAGGTLGARWGGMSSNEAWAVGFAMNSRGAMEIILGLLALEAGIIGNRLFVALVITAIVTSMMSGPVMRFILMRAKKRRLQDTLSSKLFLRELKAISRREAIHEITSAACISAGLDADAVEAAVWAREEALSTGIGNGVALPHARIEGLLDSLIVVGISDTGIDFDAPDDKSAHLIFLILTPGNDPGAQLEITSELSRIFREQYMLERVLRTKNFDDFFVLMKNASVEQQSA